MTVPPRGYAWKVLNKELRCQWMRVEAEQSATGVTAFFRLGNRAQSADPRRFRALADINYGGLVLDGLVKPAAGDARKLLLGASSYRSARMLEQSGWVMDGRLQLAPLNNSAREATLRKEYGVRHGFGVDNASVIVTNGNQRYRLPKTAVAYDKPFPTGWPRDLREVVTERNLLNVHGTIY